MEWIRQYIISVTAAAIICGILTSILGKKGTIGTIGSMLCGIFLAIAVIRPMARLDLTGWSGWMEDLDAGAMDAVAEGENMASESLSQIIMSQCEAYILDKAASLGLSAEVSVTLSGDPLPVPQTVTIRGSVSPYQRTRLSEMLTEELGIAKEDQIWTGQT